MTPTIIKNIIAQHYSVPFADLCGPSRRVSIVKARHVAMYLCWVVAGMTLTEIGDAFGREHSTVLYAIGKVDCLPDEEYQEVVRLSREVESVEEVSCPGCR